MNCCSSNSNQPVAAIVGITHVINEALHQFSIFSRDAFPWRTCVQRWVSSVLSTPANELPGGQTMLFLIVGVSHMVQKNLQHTECTEASAHVPHPEHCLPQTLFHDLPALSRASSSPAKAVTVHPIHKCSLQSNLSHPDQ